MTAQKIQLSDARWHFHHGPIDLIIQAEGPSSLIEHCHQKAWSRFQGLLAELVNELAVLRSPVDPFIAHSQTSIHETQNPCIGPVARNMWQSVSVYASPLPNGFITPMAAVAGAVAQEMLSYYEHEDIQRAWVNNGGDIALHLNPGTFVDIGWVTHPERAVLQTLIKKSADLLSKDLLSIDGQFRLSYDSPSRGVATSGWRGRSFSLGIADSVTVLARSASEADAAASIIANAVNIDHPGIQRQSARSIKDDSDLGDRLVTVKVPQLTEDEVSSALENGVRQIHRLGAGTPVHHVLLCLQDQVRYVDLTPKGCFDPLAQIEAEQDTPQTCLTTCL